MEAFASPPVSLFRGSRISRTGAPAAAETIVRRGQRVVASVAPQGERRNAEILRLREQLAQLKAKQEAAAREASNSSVPTANSVAGAGGEGALDKTSDRPGRGRIGKHSEGSRFLSLKTLSDPDFSPRVVPVVGRIPGVSPDDIRNAPRVGGGVPEPGCISWARVDSDFKGELVALSCPTEAMGLAEDLIGLRVGDVRVIAPSIVSAVSDEDGLLVLDRSQRSKEFDELKFYAWDVNGKVEIGWLEKEPSEAEAACLGRVLCVIMEESESQKKEKSCWGEVDDLF